MKFSQSGSGFSGFLDYTKRNGAVDLNNDYDLSDDHEDSKKGYDRYIDYTKRNKATALEAELKGQKVLPTFTATKLNITDQDEKVLRKKLNEAEKQNHLLWEGVVSFRTELIAKQKIYDPKNGHVDQKKIKQALQAAMPDFLKKNDLEKATWWGDIHLNTNHLHIHFGIVEDGKSKRQLTKTGEEKGMLTEASMRQLRGKVFRELLLPDQKRAIDKLKEQQAILRKKIKNDVNIDRHEFLKEELLVNAYQHLPEKKYRFKSHARKLIKTKRYLNEYIAHNLRQNSEYQAWTKILSGEEKRYEKIYGESQQNYSENQKKMLTDQIGNFLLAELYELSPKDLKSTELDVANKTTLDQDRFAIELLKRQITELSKKENVDKKKIGRLRYELGTRRGKYRKKNIRLQNDLIIQKKESLQSMVNEKRISGNDVLVTFKLIQFNKSLELHKLELRPNFQLSEKEKIDKHKLQQELIDPINIAINSKLLTEQDKYSVFVDQQIEAIKKTRLSGSYFKQKYGTENPREVIKELQNGEKVWQIKRTIANNNKVMKLKAEPELKEKLQHDNGLLFGKLTGLYRNVDSNTGTKKYYNRQIKQIEKKHLRHVSSKTSYRPTRQALHSIDDISRAATHDSVRALATHERLEEMEEQDIEREDYER